MNAHETTMKHLLLAVRSILEDARSSSGLLAGVRQIKRGVLPPKAIYPCITVVPSTERILQYRSSRRLLIQRDIVVHILTFDARGRIGFDQAKDIADRVITTLRDNYFLTDGDDHPHAKSVEIGQTNLNDGQSINGKGLYNVSIPFHFVSGGALPARVVTTSGQVDNPTARQIGEAIRDKLVSKKPTTLSGIQAFALEDWEPGTRLPRILIRANGEDQGDKWAGIDSIDGDYQVVIESMVATAKDTTLDFHLDLLEPVKDALQEDDHWAGKCYTTKLGIIKFDTGMAGDKPAYRTTVNFHTESRHRATLTA